MTASRVARARLAIAVVAACAQPVAPTHATPPPTTTAGPELVAIPSGSLRGIRDGDTLAWRGIPYAAPPVGPLRWRPPAPPVAWTGVRDASGFGYACMQAGTSSAPDDSALGSEDCLTLNVWRPARAAAARPVLVFLHGGFFTWGSSSTRSAGADVYAGARLAEATDAVVVTLNYRLGPFGFVGLQGLADEDPHHATGDYGIADQLAALQWVQRDIAAFGGDPARVTLFGQSAGATSSLVLLASPLARGLFQRVVALSANPDVAPVSAATHAGDELARRLGCAGSPAAVVACLRDKSPTAVAAALPRDFAPGGTAFWPVIDGYVLPRSPLATIAAGDHNHVPLIVSTTSAEFARMVDLYIDGPLATADDYAAMVTRRFPRAGAALLASHPAASYPSPRDAYRAVLDDAAFNCPSDAIADLAAAHQREPVYRFVFDHAYAGRLAHLGAAHGLDLLMLFRELPAYVRFDDAERALADDLAKAWSGFARDGAVAWPRRTATGHEQVVLDRSIHAAVEARPQCAAPTGG